MFFFQDYLHKTLTFRTFFFSKETEIEIIEITIDLHEISVRNVTPLKENEEKLGKSLNH